MNKNIHAVIIELADGEWEAGSQNTGAPLGSKCVGDEYRERRLAAFVRQFREAAIADAIEHKNHQMERLGTHLGSITEDLQTVMADTSVEVPEGFYPMGEELYDYLVKIGWTPPITEG